MSQEKMVGKREFIQHTSKYIKWVETHDKLIITHQNRPDLILVKIKTMSLKDLRGTVSIKINGDINDSVLLGFDKW